LSLKNKIQQSIFMILPSRTQQKSITNPSLILGKYRY